MSDDISPLWCANDDPHPAHYAPNEFGDRNYCSGRPTPSTSEELS